MPLKIPNLSIGGCVPQLINRLPPLKAPEITALLPKLTREILAGIHQRGWVLGTVEPYGEDRLTRSYSDEEVRKLYFLYRCHEAGLTTQQIHEIVTSPDKLYASDAAAFGNAVSRLCRAASSDDPKKLAQIVVSEALRVLNAECVLLYLEPETWPGRLRLAAGCACSGAFDQVHRVDPGAAYGSWLARGIGRSPGAPASVDSVEDSSPRSSWRELQIRDVCNLFSSELVAFPEPKHLPSGVYYSWLCMPLADRKGRLFGYLVAENRFGPNGKPNRAVCFDPATEALAKSYASFLSGILQIVPLVMMEERLFPSTLPFRPIDKLLKQVVRIGILLSRGFRGEIAVYREGSGMLVRAVQGPSTLPPGKALLGYELPNRSISRYVYETGEPQLVNNLKKHALYGMYSECHRETKSQLSVPIRIPFSNRPYGTLTVESHLETGFDPIDLRNLENLAAQTGSYANMVEKNAAIAELLLRFYEPADHSEKGVESLKAILDGVDRELGFTSGVVYLANYQNARLKVVGKRGCPDADPAELEKMWPFSEKSLATKVFLEQQAYFTENPWNDVFVNRKGLEAFGESGPLLGVPITFQRFVVGVLVVWSTGPVKPTKDDVERLLPFSELLVTSTQTREDSIRGRTLHSMQRIQASIRSGLPRDDIFQEILGSLTIRFDRARILEYHEAYFECLFSAGDDPPNKYRRKRVDCADSPYLGQILATPAKEAVPRVYLGSELGPDPFADVWDRPPDLGWAMTFLYDREKLWGYVAVDNVFSKRTLQHADTEELIGLYGWLTELAIAATSKPVGGK
jgi:GAF domain-containing protein